MPCCTKSTCRFISSFAVFSVFFISTIAQEDDYYYDYYGDYGYYYYYDDDDPNVVTSTIESELATTTEKPEPNVFISTIESELAATTRKPELTEETEVFTSTIESELAKPEEEPQGFTMAEYLTRAGYDTDYLLYSDEYEKYDPYAPVSYLDPSIYVPPTDPPELQGQVDLKEMYDDAKRKESENAYKGWESSAPMFGGLSDEQVEYLTTWLATTTVEPHLETVSLVDFSLDVSVAPSDLHVLTSGVAQSLNVSVDNIILGEQEPRSRRMSGLGLFRVDYKIMVPPNADSRNIVVQASKLSTGGTDESVMLTMELAKTIGVVANDIILDPVEKPSLKKTKVAITFNGSIADTSEQLSARLAFQDGAHQEASSAVNLCADDSDFVDPQGYRCSDWPGYDCSDRRWLRSERPYTSNGLAAVRVMCLLSCGDCSPAGRLSDKDLAESCMDDPIVSKLCALWRNLDCSLAPSLGYPTSYAQLLLARCPAACRLCTGKPPVCEDPSGFRDENGASCSSWNVSTCFSLKGANKTRGGVLEVQAQCRDSCGLCPSGSESQRLLGEAKSCQDTNTFNFGQASVPCNYFVGRSCSYPTLLLDTRWLLGPRGALSWHEKLWGDCPLTCGICKPVVRPTPSVLHMDCEDDPFLRDWCISEWGGRDCSKWRSMVIPTDGDALLGKTIADRCPHTCATCTEPSCGPGLFRRAGTSKCETCPKGKYAAKLRTGEAAKVCDFAWPGSFVATTGAITSVRCSAGSFSSQAGRSSCDLCSPGRFSANAGSSGCAICSLGFFQKAEGALECNRCSRGTIGLNEGSSSCTPCPVVGGFLSTTIIDGAIGFDMCVCPVGRYRPVGLHSGCHQCPASLLCKGGHIWNNHAQDFTVFLESGYMSTGGEPYSAYTCAPKGAKAVCRASRPVPKLLPENVPETYSACDDGAFGTRCHQCPERQYLSSTGCENCGDVNYGLVLFIIGGLLIIQFLGFFITYRGQAVDNDDWASTMHSSKKRVDSVTTADLVNNKLLCAPRRSKSSTNIAGSTRMLGTLQVFASLRSLNISWPIEMQWTWQLYAPFDWVVYLGLFLIHSECTFRVTNITLITLISTVPLVVILLDVLTLANTKMLLGQKTNWSAVVNTVGTLVALLFVSISMFSMQLFMSEEMPNGKKYVVGHPGLEVGSTQWLTMIPFAIFMVVFYCCGFYAYVLCASVFAPQISSKYGSFMRVAFLYTESRPQCFLWKLIDITYAFSLSLVRTVTSNPRIQVYLTMFVVGAITIIEAQMRPFPYALSNTETVYMKLAMFLFLCAAIPPSAGQEDGFISIAGYLIAIAVIGFLVPWEIWQRRGRQSALQSMRTISRSNILFMLSTHIPLDVFLRRTVSLYEEDLRFMSNFSARLSLTFLGIPIHLIQTCRDASKQYRSIQDTVEISSAITNSSNLVAKAEMLQAKRGNLDNIEKTDEEKFVSCFQNGDELEVVSESELRQLYKVLNRGRQLTLEEIVEMIPLMHVNRVDEPSRQELKSGASFGPDCSIQIDQVSQTCPPSSSGGVDRTPTTCAEEMKVIKPVSVKV